MISICESSPPLLNFIKTCNVSFSLYQSHYHRLERPGGRSPPLYSMAESFIPYIPDTSGGTKVLTISGDATWLTDCLFGSGATNNTRPVFEIPTNALLCRISYYAFIVKIKAPSTLPSSVGLTISNGMHTHTEYISQNVTSTQVTFPANTVDWPADTNSSISFLITMDGASQRQWGITQRVVINATLEYIAISF